MFLPYVFASFCPEVPLECELFCSDGPVSKSLSFIELIAALKFLNCSAGILVPAFVNPVYLSPLTNSLIVKPTFPPKSSILIMMSVSGFFCILSMSFSICNNLISFFKAHFIYKCSRLLKSSD